MPNFTLPKTRFNGEVFLGAGGAYKEVELFVVLRQKVGGWKYRVRLASVFAYGYAVTGRSRNINVTQSVCYSFYSKPLHALCVANLLCGVAARI